MRISDWSSDVCSSDLLGPVIAQSVTPRANACCVSPNDNVTGIPPRLSIRSASVLSPTRTFLPLMSASPEMAPWQNNTCGPKGQRPSNRSEEHTSELQSLMRISYAVFCLKKKNKKHTYQ